jgi:hypothetical protein
VKLLLPTSAFAIAFLVQSHFLSSLPLALVKSKALSKGKALSKSNMMKPVRKRAKGAEIQIHKSEKASLRPTWKIWKKT